MPVFIKAKDVKVGDHIKISDLSGEVKKVEKAHIEEELICVTVSSTLYYLQPETLLEFKLPKTEIDFDTNEQMNANFYFLLGCINEIHHSLCRGQRSYSWQQRAEQAVAKAKEISGNK